MVLGVEPACKFGEGTQESTDLSLRLVGPQTGKVMAVSPLLPQCFLNAVLQCLSSTRPLRDFCLRRDFRQEVPGGGRAQELTEGGQRPSDSSVHFPHPFNSIPQYLWFPALQSDTSIFWVPPF